nr:sigma-70 family RNA polymerase sigma factor [Desulfobacula sp.]
MNDRQRDITDEALMQRAGTGDPSAFETLVRRHQRPVVNFIFRFLKDPSEAEDLAQEVFLSIWKSRGAYRPDAKFTTWLYRITVNRCINRSRALKIRQWFPVFRPERQEPESKKEPLALNEGIDATTPEDSLIQSEQEKKIRRALDALPQNQRLAILLKIYNGFSYREIAAILDCSVPAVESLLVRAKQNLQKN